MIRDWFDQLVFMYPEALWVMLLVSVIFILQLKKDRSSGRPISSLSVYSRHASWRSRLVFLPAVFRYITFSMMVLAMARPQRLYPEKKISGSGLDIILCMDVSGSMLAEDFLPNRLEAAKEVVIRFVRGRPTDRIGLVLFSGEAYLSCPLTADKKALVRHIQALRSGFLEDGTAIGDGLAVSMEGLRSSVAKGKLILLVTDGENNAGTVLPAEMATLAASKDIRIYTIGVAKDGHVLVPTTTSTGVERRTEKLKLDEPLLRSMAHATGGIFFRAGDKDSLMTVYDQIDQLERTPFTERSTVRAEELYSYFLLIALMFFLLENFLTYRVFRSYP